MCILISTFYFYPNCLFSSYQFKLIQIRHCCFVCKPSQALMAAKKSTMKRARLDSLDCSFSIENTYPWQWLASSVRSHSISFWLFLSLILNSQLRIWLLRNYVIKPNYWLFHYSKIIIIESDYEKIPPGPGYDKGTIFHPGLNNLRKEFSKCNCNGLASCKLRAD